MDKPYFKQHIPGFVDGVKPKKFEFEKLEDVLKEFDLGDNYYWCYNTYEFENYQYLMQERKDNKEWWAHPIFDYTSAYEGNAKCSQFPGCSFKRLQAENSYLQKNIADIAIENLKLKDHIELLQKQYEAVVEQNRLLQQQLRGE